MTGKRVFLLGAGVRILTGRVETFSTFEFILIVRDEHRDESRCGTLRACATIQVQRINRVRRGLGPSASIHEAMDDSQASYTLGFDTPNRDGKYHKVHVSCARVGIHILTQDGYYAFAAGGPGEEESMIEAAKRSPMDAGEMGVRAIVSPSKKIPQAVRLNIRINADDVQMARSESGYNGHVSVTLIAYDAGGQPTVLKQTGYPFHMTADQHQDAMKNGIKLSPDQPVTDDAVKIRIIVFDRSSNAIGWLTVPIASEDRSPKE